MRGWRRSAAVAIAGIGVVALALTGCSPQTVTVKVPAQVSGQLPDDVVSQIKDAVTAAMTASGSSGAIVGVWAPWSGSWTAGLGTQGAGGAEVTADMGFRAGRVTRAMTCDLVYETAAKGTFSLDDSVTKWVSGLPGFDKVTLRDLCNSTSGIGAYSSYLHDQWRTNPTRVWNPRELMAYGVASPPSGDPGTTFVDSGTNYILAGLALEKATGETLSDLIAEHVAQPLGLTGTSLPDPAPAAPSSGASLNGYWSAQNADGSWNCAEPTDVTVASSSAGWADSGAVTDIDDLGRYAQALATGALLPDGNDRFRTPLPVGSDEPTWFTAAGGAYQAGSLIGQYGMATGYITAAFADPQTGMSVAVVLNNSAADTHIGAWLAWELAAIVSKAPAAAGQTMPQAGLPWTAQQMHDQIAAKAICSAPAK